MIVLLLLVVAFVLAGASFFPRVDGRALNVAVLLVIIALLAPLLAAAHP